MVEKFKQPNKSIEEKEVILQPPTNLVEFLYSQALSNESYEDVALALERAEALQNFRKKTSELPFGSFSEIVEGITNINQAPFSEETRKEYKEKFVSEMLNKVNRFSPRVADLYQAMLAEIIEQPYKPHFDITQEKMDEMKKSGDFYVLLSPNISWDIKLNRIESRLIDYLAGVRALDKREQNEMDDDVREWRQEQLKKAPSQPPSRKNETKPGVDPFERLKEGERVPAIWSIYPAWGGYYKEQSFSQWDSQRNVWTEEGYTYKDVETIPLSNNQDVKKGPIDITMTAKIVTGQWINLPIPYTHSLSKIEAGSKSWQAQQDQNGDLVIFVEGHGESQEVKVVLAPNPNKKFISSEPSKIKIPNMPAEFSEETNKKLEEIKNTKSGNISRASALMSYVKSRIKYLAPKDYTEAERYNSAYNNHSKGFAGAVDELKEGDCDVVNTYFAALCVKLNIPVRHCIGHSVKGKDEKGYSNINSGTGHGWSEVWNEVKKEWVRMDATPPGDTNLEEDNEKTNEESVAGDYNAEEIVCPTEEQLEALRKKLAELKEKLSYTKEERQLAEVASIELKEARQIVKEIHEAELTSLPSGELVIDALAKLFNSIVESRKATMLSYEGPVRKREGGESIEDIVRHKIGILSGETDPLSREKPTEEIKEEKILGGFDLYLIGDKSGSMERMSENEALWQIQRRAIYLILSSLYYFERNLERANLSKDNSLSVRTQVISFRGSNADEIDVDKPLSTNFNAQDKVRLWHSLTEQGGGNGDPEALSVIYEQIKKEAEELKKQGIKDNRLRLIIACSDGGYVGDDSAKMQMLAKMFYELKANVILVGLGLTESAANVPIVMNNPPYSRGGIVKNINDLPIVLAKEVVLEAIKLFPEKAREGANQIIKHSLDKFKNM
ncbi:MAG: transglutaminase domain-containing protein [Candidatus Pacebacteria bacterium]|nr:transglutaminase domain-containing protein [Candidatus Paceibacterota bacterium]